MKRPLIALTLALCVSCGASERRQDLSDALRDFDDRGDEHLDARRKALMAQNEAAPSATVARRAELRLEGEELTRSDEESKRQVEVRVPLQNPFRLGADRQIHAAEVGVALADLRADALALDVRSCIESARFAAHGLDRMAWEDLRADLAKIDAWLIELRGGLHLSEVDLKSQLLAHKSTLLRAHPGPPPIKPLSLRVDPLKVSPPKGALKTDSETLASLLSAHPIWQGYEAGEERLLALSDEMTARRLPWFQWLSVNIEPGRADRQQRVEALISLAIPLGIEERARAKVQDRRAEALRSEAKALFALHLRQLEAALLAIAEDEGRAPELIALSQETEDRRDEALAWIESRSVTPQQARGILEDAHDIRRALTRERQSAALLRCEAMALTGQHISNWPRATR